MKERGQASTGQLGMRLFLLSLSVLFAASIVGFLVVRARASVWPPEGAPPLPPGLWLSTGLILLSSWSMAAAGRRLDQRDHGGAVRFLVGTLLLALAFLANQALNWLQLWPVLRLRPAALYVFSFLLLTVLHALHVLGGVASLGVVTVRAQRERLTLEGFRYAGMYWHFLTGVWLVLFAVLQFLF